jgi:hypothetical protein
VPLVALTLSEGGTDCDAETRLLTDEGAEGETSGEGEGEAAAVPVGAVRVALLDGEGKTEPLGATLLLPTPDREPDALREAAALAVGAAEPVTEAVAEAAAVRNKRRTRFPSATTAPPTPSAAKPLSPKDSCAKTQRPSAVPGAPPNAHGLPTVPFAVDTSLMLALPVSATSR